MQLRRSAMPLLLSSNGSRSPTTALSLFASAPTAPSLRAAPIGDTLARTSEREVARGRSSRAVKGALLEPVCALSGQLEPAAARLGAARSIEREWNDGRVARRRSATRVAAAAAMNSASGMSASRGTAIGARELGGAGGSRVTSTRDNQACGTLPRAAASWEGLTRDRRQCAARG
jgi:hypothetical protein